MGLNKRPDEENHQFADVPIEESSSVEQKQKVRRLIEDKMEQKRLKKELDDWDEDVFDWYDKE